MDWIVDIGKFIQISRKERKLSLREVAELLSIDVSMLSKIENGERQLQPYLLAPLAKILNIPFRELQIRFLKERIHYEFGDQPYLKETLREYIKSI